MRDGDHFNYRRVRWLGSTARLVLLGGIVTLVVAGAAFAATHGGTTARAGVDTLVIANGFSCREQIAQTTNRNALHLAEVMQMAMRNEHAP